MTVLSNKADCNIKQQSPEGNADEECTCRLCTIFYASALACEIVIFHSSSSLHGYAAKPFYIQ